MRIQHFGIEILDKASNHINKEFYLSAKPEHMRGWAEEDYPKQVLRASLNYDMNMRFFDALDKATFDAYIAERIKKFKMVECFDLHELSEVEGLYMLVLDQFKQVYIGISGDMKTRIQTHWNKQKSLERLIFGDICSSTLSIDSFGALDTTRIFYIKSHSAHRLEAKVVHAFSPVFSLNRTAGGIGSWETDTDSMVALSVLANSRGKNLASFADIDRLREVVSEVDFAYYLRMYPELKEKL